MLNFFKKLLGIHIDDINDNHEQIINLINYHYNVDNIYNNLVIVNLDVDKCDISNGQIVKLLNKLYTVQHIEFIPSNVNFRYKLCLIEYDNEQ